MDWKDIGKLVAPFAPILGGVFGGPFGAIAGKVLGSFLGLGGDGQPAITPETLQAAIAKGGDVAIEAFHQAEAEIQAKYQYLVAAVQSDAQQGQAINETMRAEIAQGVSWWHWRNLLGYCVIMWVLAPLPLLTLFLWKGNGQGVQEVLSLATALLPYFTIIAALLGYVAADTTRRMTTAMVGEHAPSILSNLAGAFVKKK